MKTSKTMIVKGIALVLAAGAAQGQSIVCCSPTGFCVMTNSQTECRNLGNVNNTVWVPVLSATSCNPNPCARSTKYVGNTVTIPDGTAVGFGAAATIDLTVGDTFTVNDVLVGLYIQHPRQGDLKVTLTHLQSGRSAVLVDRPGYPLMPTGFTTPNLGASNWQLFMLNDMGSSAYDAPQVAPPGIASVQAPIYRPDSPLSVFRGDFGFGTWRISIQDGAPGNIGWFTSGQLLFTEPSVYCYPNCDNSTTLPALNVNDFACYMNKYASGDTYANCDGSTTPPVLNVLDFGCYLNAYASGCS